MSERLSKNFAASEFKCGCPCGRVRIDEKLVQGLQKLRDKIDMPITITSGFRCKDHNMAVNGASNSLHLTGQAADITCDMSLLRLYFEAIGVPEFQTGGCGVYPQNGFIHVDVRGTRARWGRLDGKYCNIHQALEALKKGKKHDDTDPNIGWTGPGSPGS